MRFCVSKPNTLIFRNSMKLNILKSIRKRSIRYKSACQQQLSTFQGITFFWLCSGRKKLVGKVGFFFGNAVSGISNCLTLKWTAIMNPDTARHPYNIFIWWHYLIRPLPWHSLSVRSTLMFYVCVYVCMYLSHPLGSILAEFGWAPVISPASVANEARSDDFLASTYLWPFLSFSHFIKNNWARAFDRRLVRLATVTSSRVTPSGSPPPPPPPARPARRNTPADRGLMATIPVRDCGGPVLLDCYWCHAERHHNELLLLKNRRWISSASMARERWLKGWSGISNTPKMGDMIHLGNGRTKNQPFMRSSLRNRNFFLTGERRVLHFYLMMLRYRYCPACLQGQYAD